MNVDAAVARFELKAKGFLGPSLKETVGLEDLGTRAARAAGINVEGGKLRCPDNAPGAGRFTDMQQSNCAVPLTEAERSTSIGKKSLPLTQSVVEFKAGLFHAHSRIGRALQAAGSYALPGNESAIVHPGRSAAASAVFPGKPGGIGGRGLGKPRMIRCPAGYEHGGRFSPDDLTGCGRQLFANPTNVRGGRARSAVREAAGDAVRSSRSSGGGFSVNNPDAGDASATRIRGGRGGRAVQIARQADIKPVGTSSRAKRDAGIDRALDSLTPKSRAAYLVRKDGSLLTSIRKVSELNDVRTSRDMEDGALVSASNTVKNLGKDEIPILLNTDISALGWKLPNGDSLVVSKTGNLSTAEKRRLGRAWKSGMSIADLEAMSHGAIQTRVRSKKKQAVERIWIEPLSGEGAPRSVLRWVFERFLAEEADGRIGDAWRIREDD